MITCVSLDAAILLQLPSLTLAISAALDASEDLLIPNYYDVLDVSRTASFTEIKLAYHRALLASHPDKQRPNETTTTLDIDLIKQAYAVLSASETRAQFDASLAKRPSGPRPAQVVSLEEFDEVEGRGEDSGEWTYGCRCGGTYRITEADMEKGQHVVGCSSCSEVVWVGYEAVDPDEEDGHAHA